MCHASGCDQVRQKLWNPLPLQLYFKKVPQRFLYNLIRKMLLKLLKHIHWHVCHVSEELQGDVVSVINFLLLFCVWAGVPSGCVVVWELGDVVRPFCHLDISLVLEVNVYYFFSKTVVEH